MSNYEYQQLYNINPDYYDDDYTTTISDGASAWCLLAIVIAIVGGILTYFLFVRNANEPKSNFAKWLKNFLNFKIMWIEPILKIIYYIATIFIVLFSFTFLTTSIDGIIYFFAILVFGPIAIRLVYEALMMLIMIWHNTRDIADNTKKK
jgi:hypothetical protein